MGKGKKFSSFSYPSILRKKIDSDSELLIVGYASKLFRDDEKALEIDQGKHLIPHGNGMEPIKIDRYDARGHLSESELFQFESSSYDYVPSLEEREFEQMCDKERYHSLEHNEEADLMYQEEEYKRLKQSLSSKEYGMVSYEYPKEAESPSTKNKETELQSRAEDLETYVPNPLLDIPQQLVLPSTKKENQIIEKVASCIAVHGPQVEIMVKARQATNENLSFMHAGNPLNPFYNFILENIKNGRYKSGADEQIHVDMGVSVNHLNHILSTSTPLESAPGISELADKQLCFSSYDLLVRNIKTVQQNRLATSPVVPTKKGVLSVNDTKNTHKLAKSSRAEEQTAVTNGSLDPPSNIKEIITKFIHFSQTMGLHPTELAENHLMKSSKNMEFLMPDHPWHSYYKEQLAVLTEENVEVQMSNVLSRQSESSSTHDADTAGTQMSFG